MEMSPQDTHRFDQDRAAYAELAKGILRDADIAYHNGGDSEADSFAAVLRILGAWFTTDVAPDGREITFQEKWQKIAFLYAATANMVISLEHEIQYWVGVASAGDSVDLED